MYQNQFQSYDFPDMTNEKTILMNPISIHEALNHRNTKIQSWKECLKSYISKSNVWALSGNPNITLSDLQSNPELKWSYYRLTSNENIPISYILSTISSIPWDRNGISKRIDFNLIDNLKERLVYSGLSCNFRIPL